MRVDSYLGSLLEAFDLRQMVLQDLLVRTLNVVLDLTPTLFVVEPLVFIVVVFWVDPVIDLAITIPTYAFLNQLPVPYAGVVRLFSDHTNDRGHDIVG